VNGKLKAELSQAFKYLTTLPNDLPSLVELEIAKCKLMGPPSGWSPCAHQ